jgi:hypothetical protein
VLLDDREQIAEQPLRDLGQLGASDTGALAWSLDLIDGRPDRRDQRRRAPVARSSAVTSRLARRPGQPLGWRFALL